MQQGRLYLVSGSPNADSSSSGSAVVLFGPSNAGNRIRLYSGVDWVEQSFSEVSLSSSGLTPNTMYDICVNSSSLDSVALNAIAWPSLTTPPTRSIQDGRLVADGVPQQLYVGSVYVDANSLFNDFVGARTVWNLYNQIAKKGSAQIATNSSHQYSGTAPQPVNGNTTLGQGRINICTGLAVNALAVHANVLLSSPVELDGGAIGFGIDSVATFTTDMFGFSAIDNAPAPVAVMAVINPAILVGFHFLQRLEASLGGSNITFTDNSPLATLNFNCLT